MGCLTMLRGLTRHPTVRAIARRLLPRSVLEVIGRSIAQPLSSDAAGALTPATIEVFRTLLSETRPTGAVPGRVVLVCGSLQPGGAERQVVNTLAGLVGAP